MYFPHFRTTDDANAQAYRPGSASLQLIRRVQRFERGIKARLKGPGKSEQSSALFSSLTLYTPRSDPRAMSHSKFSCLLSLLVTSLVLNAFSTVAFPAYQSLAGMEERDLGGIIGALIPRRPAPPPGPMAFLGSKLVNDAAHPFIAPKPTDMRGPCPGLNTLANHGVGRN